MTLHIISNNTRIDAALATTTPSDQLLLCDEAIEHVTDEQLGTIISRLGKKNCHFLDESGSRILEGIEAIDHVRFVELVTETPKSISWY